MKRLILLFVIFAKAISFSQDTVLAQVDTNTYNPKNDFSISAFPLVFYLPETGLAFGGVGLTVFNIGEKKAWRKSQVQLGLAYTLKKQILIFAPYELYFKTKWKLNGEIGYYRYFYNYYGIGVTSKASDLETYDANYPRLLSTLSYRLNKAYSIGLQYRFDLFDIPRVDSLLAANNPTGINGGVLSTIGISMTYDTRDDIFYPRKGAFVNFTAENSANYTFSTYTYSKIEINASYYQTIKGNHILASNFFSGFTKGDAPFYSYYYFSSSKRGRGFNDRRFMDKNMSILQVEYRFPIYKRFRGVAFTSVGSVGNTYSKSFTNRKLWSYGGGLRFQLSKKQMSHIRLDIAGSAEGVQFYITIGEAF